jgi:hypothetical protein
MQEAQMQELQAQAQMRQRALEQQQSRQSYLGAIDSSAGPALPISTPRALSAGLNLQEIGALMPPKPKTMTLKPGEQVFSEDGKPMFGLPAVEKPDKPPSAILEYEYAKQQGYPGSFEQWEISRRKAGASSVSVNTGQKGFDNTLKLRGDFRSEPVYKAYQEVQSAHAQIKQALSQQSPAGDLAGATKIMKILDPGSVVRESELGMAMAATGMLDRVQNYAAMVMSGEKLTPSQRADFMNLADRLYGESVKAYSAKRSEYQGIAERNQLSVPDVLGPEPAAAGGWSIRPKGGR